MAYCRWSSNDYQCDLYCYESDGGFVVHVAENRYVLPESLPEPVDPTKDIAGFLDREEKVREILNRSKLEPIGLPFDGETFDVASFEDMVTVVEWLATAGYRVPPGLLDDLRSELGERRCPTREGVDNG